jgi:hypothetical protein
MVLFHEFVWEETYALKARYLVIVIACWIGFYFLFTFKTNQTEKKLHFQAKTEATPKADSAKPK